MHLDTVQRTDLRKAEDCFEVCNLHVSLVMHKEYSAENLQIAGVHC